MLRIAIIEMYAHLSKTFLGDEMRNACRRLSILMRGFNVWGLGLLRYNKIVHLCKNIDTKNDKNIYFFSII